jgi:hypothetical protein
MDCCDDFQCKKWIGKQSAAQRRVRERNAIAGQFRDEDWPFRIPSNYRDRDNFSGGVTTNA